MYIREQFPRDRYSQPANVSYNNYGNSMDYQPYGGQGLLPQISNVNYPSHSFHKPAAPPEQNKQNHYDPPVANNKSFIDGFDNNSSGLIQ